MAIHFAEHRCIEALQRIFPGIKIKTDKIPLQDRWPNMNEDERLAALMKLQVSTIEPEIVQLLILVFRHE